MSYPAKDPQLLPNLQLDQSNNAYDTKEMRHSASFSRLQLQLTNAPSVQISLPTDTIFPSSKSESSTEQAEAEWRGNAPNKSTFWTASRDGLEVDSHNEMTVCAIEFEGAPCSSRTYRSCMVCSDEVPDEGFPTQVTTYCTHKVWTCKSCVQSWLASQLQNNGWDMVNCPECLYHLDAEDMERNADKETFERYDALAKRAALNAIPDFLWCLSPGCTSGQVHKLTDDGPMFRCQDCRFEICVLHNVAWHSGESCEEYEHRNKHNIKKINKARKRSESWKRTWTRLCPACRAPIQKNGGCPMMSCRKCSNCFKWGQALRYHPAKNELEPKQPLKDSASKVVHWVYQPLKMKEMWESTKVGVEFIILTPGQYIIRWFRTRR
ncbi:hypothetical protein K432DRAFT_383655 [Lepidopterella palustris CBS 459.81]|uniref:RBR-type E3 ubiquitin transferase n=1 Tax=Lepidopterella palustris CBS 459.81 TaxID=1314670 RepID=A0A8E2E7S9_9PEZI|nr:hypothetical protein K432DRAFT_383655 [Lepidopterella palustris CBS 459.81]